MLKVNDKTYGIDYRMLRDTVYIALIILSELESVPESITFDKIIASDKSTFINQNGDQLTKGEFLAIRNGIFVTVAKLENDWHGPSTIYHIQFKQVADGRVAPLF